MNTCLCVCDTTRRGESLTALRTGSSSSHIVLLNGLNMLFPQDATTGSEFDRLRLKRKKCTRSTICNRNTYIIPLYHNEKLKKYAQSINNWTILHYERLNTRCMNQSVCLSFTGERCGCSASDGDFGGRMSCVYMSVSV